MLQDLFARQRTLINTFFDRLDSREVESFYQRCLACRGLLLLSGVGKSGLVAEKIATTLTSTGTRALFIPPVNFLHGDLGILTPEDLLILISKSGETEELLALLPFARRRGTPVAVLHSKRLSRLAREGDLSVYLPLESELCPFDLAPTTSTAIQLIFGDVLAVALMDGKKFSLEEYALNHPAGAIGRKATIRVEDLMLQGEALPLARQEEKLGTALVELTRKQCGCLLIVDEARSLLGVFTDGDLRRAIQRYGSGVLDQSLEALMTCSPTTASRDLLAWDAARLMQRDPKKWKMVLPIVEKERIVGLLRMHDIVQAGLSGQ